MFKIPTWDNPMANSEYQVTDLAGMFVAGVRVPDNGILSLSHDQANYPLILGQIVLVGSPAAAIPSPAYLRTDLIGAKRSGIERAISVDTILNASAFARAGLLIAAVGTSFEDGASRDTPPPATNPTRAFFNDGWLSWLRILTNQRVNLPAEYVLGASGTSWNTPDTGITAQVDAVCRLYPKPTYCIVGGVPNDIGARSFADIRTDWTAGIEKLIANGITPVTVTTLPRGSASLSAAQLGVLLQMNRHIVDYSRLRGIDVIDAWRLMADQASTSSNALAGMIKTSDNLHPSTIGAFQWGKAAAAVFNRILSDRWDHFLAAADIFNATTNKTGNLLFSGSANYGLMAGTGGSQTASTGLTHSGSLAAGVTAVRSGSSTCAWTHAKENPRTDAGRSSGERQVETIAANSGGGGDEVYNLRFSPAFANFAPGDVVEAMCSIEAHQAPARATALELYLLETRPGANTSYTAIEGALQSSLSGFLPAETWSGVLRAPPIRIEDDATAVALNIRARLDASAAAASIGFKVGDVSLRKIIS